MLVNAHTHLELGSLASLCPSEVGTDFTTWLGKVLGARSMLESNSAVMQKIAEGISNLRSEGVGAVFDISSTGLSLEPLFSSGLSGVVFIEVLGLDESLSLERLERAKCEISTWKETAKDTPMQIGISLHSPYSCHPKLLANAANWIKKSGVPLAIHAAESSAETELLRSNSGSLASLLKARGFELPDFNEAGSISYLDKFGLLHKGTLLIHCCEVTAEDIALIAARGCSVVHCPRSNSRLHCRRMPLELMVEKGINVCLGTDSLASSPTLSVLEEAAFAVELHRDFLSEEQVLRLMKNQPFQSG